MEYARVPVVTDPLAPVGGTLRGMQMPCIIVSQRINPQRILLQTTAESPTVRNHSAT
jgi:hypothetical protein